jgi:hypothetical protein
MEVSERYSIMEKMVAAYKALEAKVGENNHELLKLVSLEEGGSVVFHNGFSRFKDPRDEIGTIGEARYTSALNAAIRGEDYVDLRFIVRDKI